MIKQLYIVSIILIMTISFYSCEKFNVKPNEGNLTYKIVGNSAVSNEEGLFITRLNDDYILGGITNITSAKDYMLAKVDKNGKVALNFNAGLSTDDALMQVIVTDEASNELFVLLNQESKESFKLTPSLAKVIYATLNSNTTVDKSIFLERDLPTVDENDVIEEITVKALYLESSNKFLVLSNVIEKDNEKLRITLVDQLGNKTWSRIYSFNNGTSTPPSLEGVGITQKSTGNFTVMGNMITKDANGKDKVRIFVLEIDDLGNEVNIKFPIQNEFLLDFANTTADNYALITTQTDDLKTEKAFKDLKTYKYNTTSFSLAEGKDFSNNILIGKSVQKIGQNIIITAIKSANEKNTALIYKLDLDLNLIWEKEYYYSEASINRLDIGNAIERIGGGYAVIGTHDLKSSTKMVLLLLDEDGNYIDN